MKLSPSPQLGQYYLVPFKDNKNKDKKNKVTNAQFVIGYKGYIQLAIRSGLFHIRRARKGKDSINNGIDYIQDFHIIVHPKCVNFITEISNYTWDVDSKTGKNLNKPIDDSNHLMDAMRYALEDFSKGAAFSFD